MQNELRQRIREAIDQRARARQDAAHANRHYGQCAGCGCDRELKTKGCKRCSDRHLKWAYRTDPAYIAKELERQRKRSTDRVARQKARRAEAKTKA